MVDSEYPRDLVMIGAIFGVAAFVWAGWGQEQPPRLWVWRIVLGLLGLAGVALAALSIPLAVRNWGSPTAIVPGTTAFIVYIVVFWVEVAVGALAAYLLIRAGHAEFVAPLILLVVGIHFFALAVVFGQPVLHLAGGLLSAIAIVAAALPRGTVAPSFWCGVLGAPVLLAIGAWCAVAGAQALRAG